MTSTKLTGEFPTHIASARALLKARTNDEDADHFYLPGDTVTLVREPDAPSLWAVWIDGDPVDVINLDAFRTASQLARILQTYNPDTGGTDARRGYQ